MTHDDQSNPRHEQTATRDDRAAAAETRCLNCGAPVGNIVCGRKMPCPGCGFPYPLGDCSDLAEN